MASYAIKINTPISNWTAVSGWHTIDVEGTPFTGIENGEIGIATLEVNVLDTPGTSQGFFLDTDSFTTPVTSVDALPIGFQILGMDVLLIPSGTFAELSGSGATIVYEISSGSLPPAELPVDYTGNPPPNEDVFGTFVITATVTAGVANQVQGPVTADPSATTFLSGDYDLLAPGDEIAGFYSSVAPGIRAGQAADIQFTSPGPPRGIVVREPFTEAIAMHGAPGHATTVNNKLYYAAGGYDVGVENPTIRVWDGYTDTEFCAVPPITNPQTQFTLPALYITSVISAQTNGKTLIYFATWDSGTNSATLSGRVFSVDPTSGQLSLLGQVAPIPTGHLPYSLAASASYLWCGTHRGDSTAAAALFKASLSNPSSWILENDLTGTGQTAITSLVGKQGGIYVGTFSETTNALVAFVGNSSPITILNGPSDEPGNGFYGMVDFNGAQYVAYYDPSVSPDPVVTGTVEISPASDSVFGASTLNDNASASNGDFGDCLQNADDGKYVSVTPSFFWRPDPNQTDGSRVVAFFEDDGSIPTGATINSVLFKIRHRANGTLTPANTPVPLIRYTTTGIASTQFTDFRTASFHGDMTDPEQAAFFNFTPLTNSFEVWAASLDISSKDTLFAGNTGNGNVEVCVRANDLSGGTYIVDRIWLEVNYTTGVGSNSIVKRSATVNNQAIWETVFAIPDSTPDDQIIALFVDGTGPGTLYAIVGKRTGGVYHGRIFFTRDGNTWTEITNQTPETGLSSRAFTNAFGAIAPIPVTT